MLTTLKCYTIVGILNNLNLKRFHLYFAGLQKKNEDLNLYIQDLVAKVMEHCPEVLAKMTAQK
jgi:hypothetical protein